SRPLSQAAALTAVREFLEELDLHDSGLVEDDVTILVEADFRPVGEGDGAVEGEARLALPKGLSCIRVDLPVRTEPADRPPGRIGRPVRGKHIDRDRAADGAREVDG